MVESAWFPLHILVPTLLRVCTEGNKVLETRASTSFHPSRTAQSSSLSSHHPDCVPSILLRCPWSHTAGPGVAVIGGVSGQDAQSPRGPEEGKDYLDSSDSTRVLAQLPVMLGELQHVPKKQFNPFHNSGV